VFVGTPWRRAEPLGGPGGEPGPVAYGSVRMGSGSRPSSVERPIGKSTGNCNGRTDGWCLDRCQLRLRQ
jgi:hypothetical protein